MKDSNYYVIVYSFLRITMMRAMSLYPVVLLYNGEAVIV